MWKHKYKEMLDRAFKLLPKTKASDTRFEIPKVSGSIQGNKTIITNFTQIAKTLRRPEKHLLKFFSRELATTGDIKKGGTIFIGKFGAGMLNAKLEKYVKEFVLCAQCKKPDTTLIKEKGIAFKHCEACGARSSVRSLK